MPRRAVIFFGVLMFAVLGILIYYFLPSGDDGKSTQQSQDGEFMLVYIGDFDSDEYFLITVLRDGDEDVASVGRYNVDVQLRADGRSYTSVRFGDYLRGKISYASATILVPVAEDMDTWRQWLESKNREHENYLRNLSPRRILPPR